MPPDPTSEGADFWGSCRPKSVTESLQFKAQKQPFDAYGKLTRKLTKPSLVHRE